MKGTQTASDGRQIQPFLKWAGGKRWFADRCMNLVPGSFDRFVEPFLGSGAMFFALRPPRALLSDLNADLISCYRSVRDTPKAIEAGLALHQVAHCKEHYYHVRSAKPEDQIQLAIWFLYLNRT